MKEGEKDTDFMTFARQWVAENAKSVSDAVLELAQAIENQNHSGASWDATLSAFVALIDAFEAEEQRKANELLAANPHAFDDLMTELKKHLGNP